MKCPMCNKEMRVMMRSEVVCEPDGMTYMSVVGCCYDCDIDAAWDIVTNTITGQTDEINLQRYFFG